MRFRRKIGGKRWVAGHVCFSSDPSKGVDVEFLSRLRPPM
jgi:hypothetical protein